MARVVVHRRAAKYLAQLPEKQTTKVKAVLEQLGTDPTNVPDVKPMAGEWAGYRRIKLGGLRIIFFMDPKNDVVYVDHVGPRGDIYK